jgi:hypothetical protein
MGAGYTLLRFDPKVSVAGLTEAAKKRGMPFEVLDVLSPEASIYDRKLVLSRPDQHVAWRGDKEPADPMALVDLVRVAAAKSARQAA